MIERRKGLTFRKGEHSHYVLHGQGGGRVKIRLFFLIGRPLTKNETSISSEKNISWGRGYHGYERWKKMINTTTGESIYSYRQEKGKPAISGAVSEAGLVLRGKESLRGRNASQKKVALLLKNRT